MTALDARARVVLARLEDGPASTYELQRLETIIHAPKQVLDLRRAGYRITRRFLPNRVALYTLVMPSPSTTDAPVGAAIGPEQPGGLDTASRPAGDLSRPEDSPGPAPIRAPVFGDPLAVWALHHPARRRRRR